MSAPLVRIRCPSCRVEYAFPEGLMGPHGARVACPSCGERFRVAHATAESSPSPSYAAAAAAGAETPAAWRDLAEDALARLEPRRERVRAAAEAGRLLAEFGPELVAAYEDYVRAAGTEASRHDFVRAVRVRLGVELPLAEDAT